MYAKASKGKVYALWAQRHNVDIKFVRSIPEESPELLGLFCGEAWRYYYRFFSTTYTGDMQKYCSIVFLWLWSKSMEIYHVDEVVIYAAVHWGHWHGSRSFEPECHQFT